MVSDTGFDLLRRIVIWIALAVIPVGAAVAVYRALAPQMESPPAMSADDGKRLYDLNCLPCHGGAGRGGVANPNAHGGKIPPLNTVGATYGESELREKVLAGVPDPEADDPRKPAPPHPMPSWEGRFTDPELQALVGYLKSLAPKTTEQW